MAWIEMPWNPKARQLRQFGLCGLVALPLFGWTRLGWTAPSGWDAIQWLFFGCFLAAGAVLGGAAVVWPKALRPLFLAACLVTFPVGLVVSEAALLLLYFGVFTPMATLFRLLGRDALRRRVEPEAVSYWTPRRQPRNAEQYFRQS
jgi:hypothetical protein